MSKDESGFMKDGYSTMEVYFVSRQQSWLGSPLCRVVTQEDNCLGVAVDVDDGSAMEDSIVHSNSPFISLPALKSVTLARNPQKTNCRKSRNGKW